MSDSCTVVVVGGGAAGLMAALWAARQEGVQVKLLEGSKKCGAKIVAAGGGRCNVLPAEVDASDFHTQGSPNVLKRLLKTWRLEDVKNFFDWDLQLPLAEAEADGRIFPECQSGSKVRNNLVEAVENAGAEVLTGWRVESLDKDEYGFLLTASDGRKLHAKRVVLASGGSSVPATGSDGHGFRLATALGHKLNHPYPALVPLTTNDDDFHQLSGVAVEVRWRAILNHKTVEERSRDLLFTHRGFSGPAILDASHWAVRDKAAILVAWGDGSEDEWSAHLNAKERRELGKALSDVLPRRLALALLEKTDLRPEMRCSNLSKGQRLRLIKNLTAFQLPINGNEGFKVAEVTGGGVRLEGVNPSTLESRATPGLFLCGEILDLTGRMGGFNFHWAWLSGRLAGTCAANMRPDRS
ncbi:MAG: aminoacetone oxidase family FAD-binding enzyme [Planctomycetota bacterium]|nr:MAG: aminoacetone oxidase family FAD-binding enzyme [Planctomycetota bacterium]